jgi:hypothetical protein
MRAIKSFLAFAALLTLVSCGASRHTSASVNLDKVGEYTFIQPLSYIFCYGDDGKGRYDAEESAEATRIITSLITMERYPFSKVVDMDYDGENADVTEWIYNFLEVKPKEISRLRVPKSLCKAIAASGHRYGIVIYSYGYVQTVGGYMREKIEKAASRTIDYAVEQLTGITGLTNPSKDYSASSPYGNVMYCAVVDCQNEEVVHFAEQVPTFASHPTERGDVGDMLHRLLKEFIR